MVRKKVVSLPEKKQPKEATVTTSLSSVSVSISTSSGTSSAVIGPHEAPTNLPLLTVCYLSALTTGATTYAFSFYSSALKSSLLLSQSQLDTLAAATFCAGVLSWLPGMTVDAWGARRTMALGGLLNTVVPVLYWMLATQRWTVESLATLVTLLSALGLLNFVGCALVTGAVFKLIVESCGHGSKGRAVGCAKGYVGVGSGVYVCLFAALFGDNTHQQHKHQQQQHTLSRHLMLAQKGMLSMLTTSWPRLLSEYGDIAEQQPQVDTLDFLLMASGLSFLSAVIPSILFLPRHQHHHKDAQPLSSSHLPQRRDGTRAIHFRVIYAGLMFLGIGVVTMSLGELYEQPTNTVVVTSNQKNANSAGSNHTHSRYMTKNLLPLTTQTSKANTPFPTFLNNDSSNSLLHSFSQEPWVLDRELSSSPTTPARHWGTALLFLFLWWGPALSLLIIPPKKESSYEYTTLNENENTYEDVLDFDTAATTTTNSEENNDEHEEATFLHEVRLKRKPLSMDKKEKGESMPESTTLIKRDFTMIQMLQTGQAWLMAWTFVVIVGGGTLMTNNIGQMTESLGFDPDITPASLALFSVAQGASRVITGSLSEAAMNWNLPSFCSCFTRGTRGGITRPAFLVLASMLSAISHFILALVTNQNEFALGVTLSGVAFGMIWPLMVLISGEVFGTLHVGANYMFFDGFSSAIGTLFLSKFVAQTVYDHHIIDGDADDDTLIHGGNHHCYGKKCFQMSHLIVSFLSLTCVVSSIGVMRTTKDAYHRS